MSGITNLKKLLKNLSPQLQDGEFIFASFHGSKYGDHAHLQPVATVAESEGLTLVIPQEKAAEHGLAYEGTYRMITLQIHSSLEAVGLTAAFATKLGEHKISANVVAGFFHDHIFVQTSKAEEAIEALKELQS